MTRFFEYATWDQRLDDVEAIASQLRGLRGAGRFLGPALQLEQAEQLIAAAIGALDDMREPLRNDKT